MPRGATLYTPQVLALAVSLAEFPLTDAFAHAGAARSVSCGSSLTLGLDLDDQHRIERIGLRSQACAIGQAAAAIFAAAAKNRDRASIAAAERDIRAWLGGAGPLPDWPGLSQIAAAADYPARHGAVLLPWRAALDALPSEPPPG